MAKGNCSCGAVAFEVDEPLGPIYVCHCSICRRSTGANGVAVLVVPKAQFRWTRGEEQVVDYRLPQAVRFGVAFCRRCGGSTPRVSKEIGRIVAPAGALDTDPGMRPIAHIFVGSKAPWFEITDSVPQMEGAPPLPTRR